jgi:hypothetical protein
LETTKIHRVFFHELGHFVGHLMNQKYYDGLGVDHIQIYHCKKNYFEYCGHTEPIKPASYVQGAAPPIERLASVLARVIHGCFFQSYYQDKDLRHCFSQNGEHDLSAWRTFISSNKLDHAAKEFSDVEEKYYKNITSENSLAPFIGIDPSKYLQSKNDYYVVDLQLLENDISPFLDEYFKLYENLINDYNEIINRNKIEDPSEL